MWILDKNKNSVAIKSAQKLISSTSKELICMM